MMVKGWKPWMPEKERDSFDRFEADQKSRWGEFGMDPGPKYFDREGDPISFADWIEAFEDFDYKVVAKDIRGDFEISTVWMGLDHNYSLDPDAPPIIFETMVFKLIGDNREMWDDKYMERYPSEEAALRGHRQAVVGVEADLIDG